MHKIDLTLIEKLYAPVAGWSHRTLGVDQWKLSIECLNGTIAFHLAGVALTIAGKGMEDGIFADLLGAAAWLAIMQLIRQAAYRQAASSVGQQTARMREWVFRTILLGILPLSLYYVQGLNNLCHTVSLIFFISHLYFKACDIPPPQTKRRLAFSSF